MKRSTQMAQRPRSLLRAGVFATAYWLMTAKLLSVEPSMDWRQLPPIPDSIGVAGPFAGVSGDALIVAGGANFPDKMPWDGGKKIWHDTAFVLDKTNGAWRGEFKLPKPLGYGVSVSHKRGLVFIGGSDARDHHAFAWLCESAERVEIHFLGQLSFSSNTEVLLPVEFTTQNLAMPATEANNIAAWRGQQAAAAAA